MSSISLSLKMLLAGSALAGLTLLACGGDDSSGGGDEKEPTGNSKSDAGNKGKDAGNSGPKKDAGSPIATGAVEGEDCTGIGGMCDDDQCDDAPCFAQCVSGTYDECKSSKDLISLFTDGGGLPTSVTVDGGTFTVKDGAVTVKYGDASIDIPGMDCPAEFECSTKSTSPFAAIINGATGGLPYCSTATGLPPSCTTPMSNECADMGFKAAICTALGPLGNSCIQICK